MSGAYLSLIVASLFEKTYNCAAACDSGVIFAHEDETFIVHSS